MSCIMYGLRAFFLACLSPRSIRSPLRRPEEENLEGVCSGNYRLNIDDPSGRAGRHASVDDHLDVPVDGDLNRTRFGHLTTRFQGAATVPQFLSRNGKRW